MHKKLTGLCTTLFCTLLVSMPQVAVAGDNILKDPGFEQQLSPEQGGWTLFDESWFSKDQARNGRQSMFNWGFSHTVQTPPFLLGSVSGSFQEFPASPGSRWRLTGSGMAPIALEGAPAFGVVQLSFFDGNGDDLGTVETAGSKTPRARTSNEINSQSSAGEWVSLDTGITTAPAGTATVQAFTLYVDYSGANISQGVYFDDLSLCAVDSGGDC